MKFWGKTERITRAFVLPTSAIINEPQGIPVNSFVFEKTEETTCSDNPRQGLKLAASLSFLFSITVC